MSANSKVSLRDEEHIASQSICCLAYVAAVWSSLGQPVFPMVVLCLTLGREVASALRAQSQSRWTEQQAEAGSKVDRGIFSTMLLGTRDLFKYL